MLKNLLEGERITHVEWLDNQYVQIKYLDDDNLILSNEDGSDMFVKEFFTIVAYELDIHYNSGWKIWKEKKVKKQLEAGDRLKSIVGSDQGDKFLIKFIDEACIVLQRIASETTNNNFYVYDINTWNSYNRSHFVRLKKKATTLSPDDERKFPINNRYR